jgi:hypothetical protein
MSAEPDSAPAAPQSSGDAAQPTVPSGGHGRGRGGGGRGRGRGSGINSRGTQGSGPARIRAPAFKGNTEGINGHVFQCHGENTDKQQFMKTVGILGEYVNKTFTYPQDLASTATPEPFTPSFGARAAQ